MKWCWWYLRSDSVHDWGGSHLTQSLTLCYECLTVLETGDQVSCQLLITSCSLHLLVTCLLQVRVQSEEHEAPAQGGGGGVWSSSKQVKTNHLQLRLAELFWILLHFQKILINKVSGIILIQSLFMSINLLIYKCSESLQDLKSPVVTSQWTLFLKLNFTKTLYLVQTCNDAPENIDDSIGEEFVGHLSYSTVVGQGLSQWACLLQHHCLHHTTLTKPKVSQVLHWEVLLVPVECSISEHQTMVLASSGPGPQCGVVAQPAWELFSRKQCLGQSPVIDHSNIVVTHNIACQHQCIFLTIIDKWKNLSNGRWEGKKEKNTKLLSWISGKIQSNFFEKLKISEKFLKMFPQGACRKWEIYTSACDCSKWWDILTDKPLCSSPRQEWQRSKNRKMRWSRGKVWRFSETTEEIFKQEQKQYCQENVTEL